MRTVHQGRASPSALALRTGARALREHPLRTALSALGVVVGVGALVAVLAVGDGVERLAREQIATTTDLQTMQVLPRTTREIDGQRVPRDDFPRFGQTERREAAAAVGSLASVTISLSGPALVTQAGQQRPRGVLVTGVLPGSETPSLRPAAAGRALGTEETVGSQHAAVVSAGVASAIGAAVGDSITIGSLRFAIVGIRETDDPARLAAWVPLDLASRVIASRSPVAPTMLVRAARIESLPEVRRAIERWLARRYGQAWNERVSVRSNRRRAEQASQALLVFELLMGSIAGVSLVVGGIGIMNVLLASVTERTREIGVRRAAGARRRDILGQFLAESVTVTCAGGVAGWALGISTAVAVTALMRAQTDAPVHAAFSWTTLALALSAAAVVGLAFGLYPAMRAARLPPIEAIRHE